MFNLWPKNDTKDIIDSMPKWEWTPTQTPSMLQAQNDIIDNLIKENNKLRDYNKNLREQQESLYNENKDLKDLLKSIEEDGTEEHNKAVELRQENAKLRVTHDILKAKISTLQEFADTKLKVDWKSARIDILERDLQKCAEQRDEYKHQLNAANKEIEALKKNIVGCVTEKVNKIEELKRTEKYYECNHCGYKIAHNTNQWGGCGCCKDGLMIEREEEQKHPMYPIHWGGYDGAASAYPKQYSDWLKEEKTKAQKEVEFSSEELLKRVTGYADSLKTTIENLEEKFDRGEDVLDYFENPEWKCPCNICKDKKEETTWEEAASDLELRVRKLEEMVEELKTVKITSDPHYKHFLNHGTWPWNQNIPCKSPKEFDDL